MRNSLRWWVSLQRSSNTRGNRMRKDAKKVWKFYARNGDMYEFRILLVGIYGELWLRREISVEKFWGTVNR